MSWSQFDVTQSDVVYIENTSELVGIFLFLKVYFNGVGRLLEAESFI